MWPSGALMCALAELEHFHDVLRRAGLEAGIFRHHVVEAHQLVVDLEIVVERGRPRLVGVDDRQDVAHAGAGVLRQLGDAADGDAMCDEGHGVFYSRPVAMCRPTPSMPKMKILRNVSGDRRRRALCPSHTPAMVGATAPMPPAMLVK